MVKEIRKSKSLKLLINKTFGAISVRRQPVKLALHDSIDVIATVIADNVKSCQLSISYPPTYFELQNEQPELYLNTDLIHYEKDIIWTLKALKSTPSPLWVSISAIANGIMQEAGFNIEVYENE